MQNLKINIKVTKKIKCIFSHTQEDKQEKRKKKKNPNILYAGIKDHKFILEDSMCTE